MTWLTSEVCTNVLVSWRWCDWRGVNDRCGIVYSYSIMKMYMHRGIFMLNSVWWHLEDWGVSCRILQEAFKDWTHKNLLSFAHVINSKYNKFIYNLDSFSVAILVSLIFKPPLTKRKKLVKWNWASELCRY
jgi:hypothetical protein